MTPTTALLRGKANAASACAAAHQSSCPTRSSSASGYPAASPTRMRSSRSAAEAAPRAPAAVVPRGPPLQHRDAAAARRPEQDRQTLLDGAEALDAFLGS